MPASQFFVMLEAARAIRNKERVLDCWQSRAGTVNPEGFKEILDFFEQLDMPKRTAVRPPDVVVPTEKPPLRGEAARERVMSVFMQDRRINRKWHMDGRRH